MDNIKSFSSSSYNHSYIIIDFYNNYFKNYINNYLWLNNNIKYFILSVMIKFSCYYIFIIFN